MASIIIVALVALASVFAALAVAIATTRPADPRRTKRMPSARERYGVDATLRPVRIPGVAH